MKLVEYWLEDLVNSGIARLENKSLAVDVGANAGTWTIPLSEEFDSVVAIEPDPRMVETFPSRENVTLIANAASDESGDRPFFFRASSGHNSLLEQHPIGGESGMPAPSISSEVIHCVALDDVCPGGADFLKMDIEGGEVLALAGCKDSGRWARTFFLVECHDTFAEVSLHLQRLGKRVTRVPHPFQGAHPQHCWAIGE